LLREGRYEEAAAWFRRIAVDAPESPVGYLNLGIALLRAGKVAEAVAVLEAARERDPEEPAAYRYLVQAYAKLGREGERRAAEEQLRRLNLSRWSCLRYPPPKGRWLATAADSTPGTPAMSSASRS
jgi:predicted Zn-dependent protease